MKPPLLNHCSQEGFAHPRTSLVKRLAGGVHQIFVWSSSDLEVVYFSPVTHAAAAAAFAIVKNLP